MSHSVLPWRHRRWMTWLGLLLLLSSHRSAAAHSGHDSPHRSNSSFRSWTLADGTKSFNGSLVTRHGSQIIIERESGICVSLEMDRLAWSDQQWVRERLSEIEALNTPRTTAADERYTRSALSIQPARSTSWSGDWSPIAIVDSTEELPAIAAHFQRFPEVVRVRADDEFLYVESHGMPNHPMMKGITAWQQQVPLPQPYTGENAWRIPLNPRPAANPLSCRDNFFRGAIALAVNGVPIFNPIKNDGRTDTLLAGELDEWGGHCGRADDYHYHIAPVHLQEAVGEGNPIAFALDGYPILGFQTENDQKPLDRFNGHEDEAGRYHYHATRDYPYLNGGFHGEVRVRDGQVDPQPRAEPLRPAGEPLRGATIVDFQRSDDGKSMAVFYELRGRRHSVNYQINDDRSVRFVYSNGGSRATEETYRPRSNRRPPRRPPPPNDRPSPTRRPDQAGIAPVDQADSPLIFVSSAVAESPTPLQASNAVHDEPRQSPTADVRRPWIEVHGDELDTNRDGYLSREELLGEARRAYEWFARDDDEGIELSRIQRQGRAKSALGGFLQVHADELDLNGNERLELRELESTVLRMFEKVERDRLGRFEIGPVSPSLMPDVEANPEAASIPGSTERRPNIVFLLVDDLGWHDIGLAGNEFVETPNIDRLGREGVWFTAAYAAAPNCAPTRACLLSGQYTPRHGIYTVVDDTHAPGRPWHRIMSSTSSDSLPAETMTIAELLQGHGYATACYGMWNLGRGRNGPTTPLGQGFEEYSRPSDLGFERNRYLNSQGRRLTDVLFDQGLDFVERHADEPFFLYLPTHAVHAPYEPDPEMVAKYRERALEVDSHNTSPEFAAMIESVDQNLGRLVAMLERLGIDDRTWIIVTSDNGGMPENVKPLNGSKGSLYEGGLRVPCVIAGPGVVHTGRSIDWPTSSIDFLPTIAAWAGAEIAESQPCDGVDLGPLLADAHHPPERDLYWHFPCYIGRGEPSSAMRSGDWKLIEFFETPRFELYDLSRDPGEATNLMARHPEIADRLTTQLREWQTSLDAPRPANPNPNYDPNARPQRGRQRR